MFGYKLPNFISKRLFGDRDKWSLVPDENDVCWREWSDCYLDFYYTNQKNGIGRMVNNAGYRVMGREDFNDKKVLEIGPGDIRHLPYWRKSGTKDVSTTSYVLADIKEEMLLRSSRVLEDAEIPHRTVLLDRDQAKLPFDDEEFDYIVTFYALEHINPLGPYLDELKRIIKTGGKLVGAIPAEGGLAWGLGRFLTSRRWLHKNTNIDPDKIICWEHPNFADQILALLEKRFTRDYRSCWPLLIPVLDINLVIKFVYQK